MPAARQIYQTLLDDLTEAVQRRDVSMLCDGLDLPYEFRTLEGTVVYRTRTEVEAAIKAYFSALTERGVTEIQRVCDTAQYLGGRRISGYHTTHVMRGQELDAAPFLSRMNLVETEGGWKFSICDNSLRSADWTIVPGWYETTATVTETPHEASDTMARMHLFQTILDRISAAFLAGDAEGWLNSLSLPCHLITRQGAETFETAEQVRADFALYQQEFELHGITEIVREAKTAEIIDGDQMVGTYTTHLLRRGRHVVPPWDGSMTLRCENNLWRVTTVMRAIGHLNWTAVSRGEIENIPQDESQKGERE